VAREFGENQEEDVMQIFGSHRLRRTHMRTGRSIIIVNLSYCSVVICFIIRETEIIVLADCTVFFMKLVLKLDVIMMMAVGKTLIII
jgi:hypothetical protein